MNKGNIVCPNCGEDHDLYIPSFNDKRVNFCLHCNHYFKDDWYCSIKYDYNRSYHSTMKPLIDSHFKELELKNTLQGPFYCPSCGKELNKWTDYKFRCYDCDMAFNSVPEHICIFCEKPRPPNSEVVKKSNHLYFIRCQHCDNREAFKNNAVEQYYEKLQNRSSIENKEEMIAELDRLEKIRSEHNTKVNLGIVCPNPDCGNDDMSMMNIPSKMDKRVNHCNKCGYYFLKNKFTFFDKNINKDILIPLKKEEESSFSDKERKELQEDIENLGRIMNEENIKTTITKPPTEPLETKVNCPKCNGNNIEDSVRNNYKYYCSDCYFHFMKISDIGFGFTEIEGDGKTILTQTPKIYDETTLSFDESSICTNCGFRISERLAKFCSNCGGNLTSENEKEIENLKSKLIIKTKELDEALLLIQSNQDVIDSSQKKIEEALTLAEEQEQEIEKLNGWKEYYEHKLKLKIDRLKELQSKHDSLEFENNRLIEDLEVYNEKVDQYDSLEKKYTKLFKRYTNLQKKRVKRIKKSKKKKSIKTWGFFYL